MLIPSLWPWLKTDIKLQEDVQRPSNKLVKCLRDTEYEGRAQMLNVASFSCKMDKGDTILVSKVLHCFLDGVQWRDFFQMAGTSRL